MDKSLLLTFVAIMVLVLIATIWLVKRFAQPSTPSARKRVTVFLRFIVAQYVIITVLALLTAGHMLSGRMLGVLGLANFIFSFVIMWAALKKAPISDQDVTRQQRLRVVKSSKLLIVILVIALINGLFHIRTLPLLPAVVGIAVNILMFYVLITNLRRNKAKLDESK